MAVEVSCKAFSERFGVCERLVDTLVKRVSGMEDAKALVRDFAKELIGKEVDVREDGGFDRAGDITLSYAIRIADDGYPRLLKM